MPVMVSPASVAARPRRFASWAGVISFTCFFEDAAARRVLQVFRRVLRVVEDGLRLLGGQRRIAAIRVLVALELGVGLTARVGFQVEAERRRILYRRRRPRRRAPLESPPRA